MLYEAQGCKVEEGSWLTALRNLKSENEQIIRYCVVSANDRAYPGYCGSTEWSSGFPSVVGGLLEAPELFLRDLQGQIYFHNIRHLLFFALCCLQIYDGFPEAV